MAENYYHIPDKPVYNSKVRELQNSDSANAQETFNPLIQRILENIAAVKELADSALKLAEPRRIGNASFDGTEDISLEQIGAAAAGHTHPVQTDITGNAGTANKLKNARKIGNASFDGSADITLAQIGAAASGHTHPVQTDVTGNAGTAAKLKTARKINGMNFDGSADRANYALCSTAAGTAAKTVDCSGFALATGAEITVKFTVTNTAANPTLNVSGTGAKAIYYRGAAISAGYLAANRTYTFRYNGAQYELVGDINTDTNTTYGNMKAATASAAGGAGLVPAPAAGAQGKYLRGDGTWQTPPNTTYAGATASTGGLMSAADKAKLDGIAAQANKYSHPTAAGNKHIPAGGSSYQLLEWSADGTAAWKSLESVLTNENYSHKGGCGITAFGSGALNTSGGNFFNTAIGAYALAGSDRSSNYNTVVGGQAVCKLTAGEGNTVVGAQAFRYLPSGNNNTAVGYVVDTGGVPTHESVFIGYNTYADTNADSVKNVIVIGASARGTANNQITLGNSSITQLRCKVTSIASLSDKRVKEDIHPADTGICLKDVLRLPVTRYKYKDFTGTNLDNHVTGWMADDYEKVFPKGVQANDEMFPVLDENGNETFEEVIETRKAIDPETGEEKEVQEVRQQRKMFTLEKVKTITPSEALPTLWGAVQELAKKVRELTAEIKERKGLE